MIKLMKKMMMMARIYSNNDVWLKILTHGNLQPRGAASAAEASAGIMACV